MAATATSQKGFGMSKTPASQEDLDRIQSYLEKHFHMFLNSDFRYYIWNKDARGALGFAVGYHTTSYIDDEGNRRFCPESMKYGALLAWIELTLKLEVAEVA